MTIPRLHIVCPEHAWILDKFARKIQELAETVEVSRADTPDRSADVNYYLNWYVWHMLGRPRTYCDLLFFTHINRGEDALVRGILTDCDHATVMSTWHLNYLVDVLNIPEDKLTVILPAADDGWKPRPIRLGITCRFYSDGRRQEWELIEAARRGAFEGYELHVIGEGWDYVLHALENYGVKSIHYIASGDYQADYALNRAVVPELDYILHTDKATSIGVLDALACGVPVICQRTGFAVDFATEPGAAYWYDGVNELEGILRSLRAARWRIGERVRGRSWQDYVYEVEKLTHRLAGL